MQSYGFNPVFEFYIMRTVYQVVSMLALVGGLYSCAGLKNSGSLSDELYAPRNAEYTPPAKKTDTRMAEDDRQYQEYEQNEYSKNQGEYQDDGYYDGDNGGFCGSCISNRRFFYDPFFSPYMGWGWGGGWGLNMGWGMGGWGFGMGYGWGGLGWYDPFWGPGWGMGYGMGWGGWGWGNPWMTNPYFAYQQGFWAGYNSGIWNHDAGRPNRVYGHRGSVLSSNTNQYGGGGGRSTGSGSGNRTGSGASGNNSRQITGNNGSVQSGRSSGTTQSSRGQSNTGNVKSTGRIYSSPRTVDPYDGTRSSGTVSPGRTRTEYPSRVPSAAENRNTGTSRYQGTTPSRGGNVNSGNQSVPPRTNPNNSTYQSGRSYQGNTQRTNPGQNQSPSRNYSPAPSPQYSPAPRSGGSWGGSSGGGGGFGGSGGGGGRSGGGGGGSAPRGPR